MTYEVVFNILLVMLALLGCTLVIIFWIVFREEKRIHPIYRRLASLAEPESKTTSTQAASAGGSVYVQRRDAGE